jgi:hypothetical protein
MCAMMNGRERLNAVLQRQPRDRLPWTTLVDNASLSTFPETLRGNGGVDFYRHLGCDIFLLNGWGTPYSFRSPEMAWPASVRETRRREGDKSVHEWSTPKGTLTAVYQASHPSKRRGATAFMR